MLPGSIEVPEQVILHPVIVNAEPLFKIKFPTIFKVPDSPFKEPETPCPIVTLPTTVILPPVFRNKFAPSLIVIDLQESPTSSTFG